MATCGLIDAVLTFGKINVSLPYYTDWWPSPTNSNCPFFIFITTQEGNRTESPDRRKPGEQ